MKRALTGVAIAVMVSAVVLAGARPWGMDRPGRQEAGWNRAYGPSAQGYGGYGPRMGGFGGPMQGGRGWAGPMDRFGGRGRGPMGPGAELQRGPRGMQRPGEGLEGLELTDEKKEAVKALHEKIQAEMEAGMAEILTEEQLAKFKELKERTSGVGPFGGPLGPGRIGGRGYPGGGPLGLLRGLELTEEQQAKVKTILESSKEQAEAAKTAEAKKTVRDAAIDEIKELLTEEQIEKLEKTLEQANERPAGGIGALLAHGEELGLTEEQITKLKEIEESTKAAVEAAETSEAKREAVEDGREAVKKVLTAEQYEKLRSYAAQQRPGRGEGFRPGGMRSPRPGGVSGGFRPGRRGR